MNYLHTPQSIIHRVQRLLAQQPVYLDTETTGLSRTDEIVEICIVDHDGQVLLDSFVKPSRRIPAEVIRVHHITNAMVRNAPTWREIWPDVQAALSGRYIGIYNAVFDMRMIKQSHKQAGMTWQPLGARAFCIMNLYKEFYRAKSGSNRRQSLTKAGKQCGISLQNTHRAKADTLLARAVMNYMGGIE